MAGGGVGQSAPVFRPPWEAWLLSPWAQSRGREPASTRELPDGGGTARPSARRPGCWELGAPYRASHPALSPGPGLGWGAGRTSCLGFPSAPGVLRANRLPLLPLQFWCCGKSSPLGLLGGSEADLCQGEEATRQVRGGPATIPGGSATGCPRPSQGGGWPGLGPLDAAGPGCSLLHTALSLED